MQNTIVRNGQTPLDISMQEAGSVEAVVALALLNNISITSDMAAGNRLANVPVINKAIVQVFIKDQRYPATGEIPGQSIFEGIDFWFVPIDFQVQ